MILTGWNNSVFLLPHCFLFCICHYFLLAINSLHNSICHFFYNCILVVLVGVGSSKFQFSDCLICFLCLLRLQPSINNFVFPNFAALNTFLFHVLFFILSSSDDPWVYLIFLFYHIFFFLFL